MIDFCNTKDAILLESDLDLVLQQIEMVLDTRRGDVIGDYDYGSNFSQYLFDINLGNQTVANNIKQTLMNQIDFMGWDLNVAVDFLLGSQHDIMLVQLEISKDDEAYTRIYKVTQGDVSESTIY